MMIMNDGGGGGSIGPGSTPPAWTGLPGLLSDTIHYRLGSLLLTFTNYISTFSISISMLVSTPVLVLVTGVSGRLVR